ncbi:MAG: hypothetical protein IJ583_13570 [Firmicutes bacterium]|nr:hypothetical protein [Bacillota bacterium]
MEITVRTSWFKTEYGYYEGWILVYDKNNNVLMNDRDMYYTIDKLCMRLNRLFVNNNRFKVHSAVYKRSEEALYISCTDTKDMQAD